MVDEPVAGGEEPNTASDEAHAGAKAEMARIADAMAQGDAAIAELVHKQQEFLTGHKQRRNILDGISLPPGVLGAAAEPPGLSPSQVVVKPISAPC